MRQPYDYHSAIPGYNIPIREKTELLTTPIDTAIRKHNLSSDVTETNSSFVTLTETNMTFGTINDFENANNSNGNDTTSPFKRFKVGDMISIVISSYPDLSRVEGDITSSKSSFHRVTGINTASKVITFEPRITETVGQNALINNTPNTEDVGDRLYIYILGRIQRSESRCSKLAKNINVYSFSLRPEDHQPSGTCNFSRIDTARLITGAPLNTGDCVYAINYNILRIMSGMGGLAYSN